jgi:hypothetical protein
MSNETLKFFININISPFKENLLKYFDLSDSQYDFEKDYHIYTKYPISFDICNDNDLALFRNHFEDFNFPEGINLCPKINFLIPATSFDMFEVAFFLKECNDETKGCTRDQIFYEQLRNNTYSLNPLLYFISSNEDMQNYNEPFLFKFIKIDFELLTSTAIKLVGLEITSEPMFGIFEPFKSCQVKINHVKISQPLDDELLSFWLYLNSTDIFFHHRTYKTLSSAFSNAFSLFKLYSWIFSLLLSSYYSYNINNIIINKNFDYENSIAYNRVDSNMSESTKRISNLSEIVSNQNNLLITNKVNKKLTISLICKKVTCFRYLFCNKVNKTKSFYDSSNYIIKKYLSVEQLLFYLVEHCKIKKFVIEGRNLSEYDLKEKLILSSEEKENKNDSVIFDTADKITV